MAVKINALSVYFFVPALLFRSVHIQIEFICSHKGSAEPQDKTRDKNPCTDDIVGNKKITTENTQDKRHHKGEPELPDKGKITERPETLPCLFAIRSLYLHIIPIHVLTHSSYCIPKEIFSQRQLRSFTY